MSCPASTLRSRHVTGFAKMKVAQRGRLIAIRAACCHDTPISRRYGCNGIFARFTGNWGWHHGETVRNIFASNFG